MAKVIKQTEIKKLKEQGFLYSKGTEEFNGRVLTRNGKITAEQCIAVCEAAKKYGNGSVTFTNRLNMEIPGIHMDHLELFKSEVEACGLEMGGTGPKVRPIAACKATTCTFGLLDSFGLSEKLYERFFVGYKDVPLPYKCKIAVGGCPNNCMKPDINDIGIMGQMIPDYNSDLCRNCKICMMERTCPANAAKVVDGKITCIEENCIRCGRCVNKCPFKCVSEKMSGFKVYIGGKWGKFKTRGTAVNHFFTSEEEVLDFVEKTILFYKENGQPGERLAHVIERLGFEKVEAELLHGNILERKETIING